MFWLVKVFESQTQSKISYRIRLFIVDSHSSHLNIRFMDFCEAYRIIFNFLSPHSTHRLQPLDINIFFSLTTAYSSEIDALIQSSFKFSRTTKRNFWPLFRSAWKSVLIMSNIKSVFAATGIWFSDLTRVLRYIYIKTFFFFLPLMSLRERLSVPCAACGALLKALKQKTFILTKTWI